MLWLAIYVFQEVIESAFHDWEWYLTFNGITIHKIKPNEGNDYDVEWDVVSDYYATLYYNFESAILTLLCKEGKIK